MSVLNLTRENLDMMKDFKLKKKLNLRWRDINEFDHINDAVYLNYLEECRLDYLDQACELDSTEIGALLSKAEIEYRQPLGYKDKPFIYTRCSKLNGESFNLEYVITREVENDIEVIAKATTEIRLYDIKKKQQLPLPEEVVTRIKTFEGMVA